MINLVGTLKDLEVLKGETAQLLHSSVKHVVSDLVKQLTRLVLYGIESSKLVGYSKLGGASPFGSSGSTIPLHDNQEGQEGQEGQIRSALEETSKPVTMLLEPDYRKNLEVADAKAHAQLLMMDIETFLDAVLVSWDSVLSKSSFRNEWRLLYTQVTSTPGSTWDPFRMIHNLKREIRPSIGQLVNLKTEFMDSKQVNLSVPVYMTKLKSHQEELNLLLQFFGADMWQVTQPDCFLALMTGLNRPIMDFMVEKVIPAICAEKNLVPSQINFEDLEKELPRYSFEHLGNSSSADQVVVGRMNTFSKAAVAKGTESHRFMKWTRSNPGKCYYCLQEGHLCRNCPTPPDRNRVYPADHPLHQIGMSEEMIAALEGKKRRSSTVRLSRMGFGSTNSEEKCIHDTGCECITVIGKTDGALGIDSRSSTRSMLNFKLSVNGQNASQNS